MPTPNCYAAESAAPGGHEVRLERITRQLPTPNCYAHLKLGKRVRITIHGSFPELNGRTGRIVRITTSGDQAWMQCDEPLPGKHSVFKDHVRRDWTKIYYDECEAAK